MKFFGKLIGILSLAFALLFSTSGCFPNQEVSKLESEYVTFTYSRYVTDEPNSSIINEFWYYDSIEQLAKKIFEIEYTSQYPLGYYDKANNLIYYTKSVLLDQSTDTSGDQIFVTDLNTNTEKQLTEDLFAVNYIIPVENQLLFVARPQKSNVLQLGSLNLNTGELTYWGSEDTIDDTNIETISVDQKNKKIYVSAYSDAERRYNVLHQDGPAGKNNFKMPLHSVYKIDYSFEKYRVLFSKNEWIRTILTTDNVVAAFSDKQYNEADVPSTLIRYSLTDNTVTETAWDTYRLQIGDANYSSDGTLIYSIADINNKRGLYKYSLVSKEFSEIFIQSNGFLNNIQVVKHTSASITPSSTSIDDNTAISTEDNNEATCPTEIEKNDATRHSAGIETEYKDFNEYMKHHIPTQMEPSTLLIYGENNEPTITKLPSQQPNEQLPQDKADTEQQELLLQEEKMIIKIKEEARCLPVIELGYDLPDPEPGLAVLYGTDGQINRIYYVNEQ